MPRKRTVPDEALLDAALVIVRADGPDALTFAALAAPAGLAASTIVQRFGTKAALLQAALCRAWDLLDEATAAADERAAADPGGVIDLLVELSGQYEAADFADQLRVLREDLRDPVLRSRGQSWLATLTDAVERRLGGADGRTRGLGELIVTHWQGAVTILGFQRGAPSARSVRDALERLFQHLQLDGARLPTRRSSAAAAPARGRRKRSR